MTDAPHPSAEVRASDVSRYLGDAGHAHHEPVDDPTVEGRSLAEAAADTNRRLPLMQPGYHSTQITPSTVRTMHEGPDAAYHLRLYALALSNLGLDVEPASHDGRPCLVVARPRATVGRR